MQAATTFPSLDLASLPVPPLRPLSEVFALEEVNPFNDRPYAESTYTELPPYVRAVVGVTSDAWDGLVQAGRVGLVFDVCRVHSLAPMLGELRDRDGTGRCTACPRSGPAEWQRWPCRLHSLAILAGETLAAGPGEHRTGSTR
ncbi:MAG: hypothetical protein ACRDRH_28930 [Pseudonocardia sp.]